jgi:uncharacterized ion transporter superfamily protein YfcC
MMEKKLRFPNALAILIGFILVTIVLTYVIPPGQYERTTDAQTGQLRVVAGSYQQLARPDISLFDLLLSIPEGIIGRAELLVLIFLVGGCFYVIDQTGALREGITFLSETLAGREAIALVIVSLFFTMGGALEGMQEEIIGMMPMVLYFSQRLGYNAFVAIGVSYGSAVIGSSFSPTNPFAIVIAQRIAELPFLSGAGYRMAWYGLAQAVWITALILYGNRNRSAPIVPEKTATAIQGKNKIILFLLAGAFVLLIVGLLKLGWGVNEISLEFFLLGLACGLISGMGINGTCLSYIDGFKELTFAAMIMGLANSITVVLQKGLIIDAIIHAIFLPLEYLPTAASAILMMISQAILHLPVSSYSGQALLTMPILIPLSDLIGLSRQVCVLAYQYGAVLMDLVVPTNGALMAILAVSGVSYDQWISFVWKLALLMLAIGAMAVLVGIAVGV